GVLLALGAWGAPSRRALRAGSRAGDTAPSVLPMICEDGHPDRWSDLMNASFFRGRVQAATAMVAAALIALAGCGPAEDPPAPETDTVEHEGPAGDETEHDGDGNSDDDPAADANEEDRTRGDDVQGSADPRALVFVHVVDPERLVDEDGEMRLPSGDLAEIIQDLGGVAEGPAPGAEPASCEND